MSSKLIAIIEGEIMGEITYGGGRMVFRYATAWQESESAFPLSLAMPLVVREHGHAATEAFLWGLLPDNETVLQRWGQRFRVSARNPFRLLEYVGEDCAGAVQFAKPERVDLLLKSSRKPSVSWVSDKDLSERMDTPRIFPCSWGANSKSGWLRCMMWRVLCPIRSKSNRAKPRSL